MYCRRAVNDIAVRQVVGNDRLTGCERRRRACVGRGERPVPRLAHNSRAANVVCLAERQVGSFGDSPFGERGYTGMGDVIACRVDSTALCYPVITAGRVFPQDQS